MLNNKQKKFLKAQAHHLKPVIMVGNAGISESLLKETEKALEHHELLKIKLPAGDKARKQTLINQICEHCNAEAVQSIGRTVCIYRPAREPVLSLPQ